MNKVILLNKSVSLLPFTLSEHYSGKTHLCLFFPYKCELIRE